MSEARYTAGPWRLSGKSVIRAGENDWIADVNWRNREANARLIAAAPDLLEALLAVVRVADRKTNEFDLAHAAIAKAQCSDKNGDQS